MKNFIKPAVVMMAMLAAAAFVSCNDDDDDKGKDDPKEAVYVGNYTGTYVCSVPDANGQYTALPAQSIAFSATDKEIVIGQFPVEGLLKPLADNGIIPADKLATIEAALKGVKIEYKMGIGTVSEAEGVSTAQISTPALNIMNMVTVEIVAGAPMTYTAATSTMEYNLVVSKVTMAGGEPVQLGLKIGIKGQKSAQ